MQYIGDSQFWNEKFNQRSDKALPPEQEILNHKECLIGDSILDIACGDGRNALYFLRQGYRVTGIDFSSEGISRLKKMAHGVEGELTLREIDLSRDNALDNIDRHDNVLICHYRLSTALLKKLSDIVNEKGTVIITGFSENHSCDEKISPNELIYEPDIEVMLSDFELIRCIETCDARGNFVTYVLKKY